MPKEVVKVAKTFRIDPEVAKKLKELAAADRRSETGALEVAIEEAWKARFPEKVKKP